MRKLLSSGNGARPVPSWLACFGGRRDQAIHAGGLGGVVLLLELRRVGRRPAGLKPFAGLKGSSAGSMAFGSPSVVDRRIESAEEPDRVAERRIDKDQAVSLRQVRELAFADRQFPRPSQ